MRAVVLFDSQFGNTERVARAVARALEPHGVVRALAVTDHAGSDLEADLLVVGAPTQVHGMGRRALHRWLERLPVAALDTVAAAAFDTRIRGPVGLTGSAATGLAKRLRAKGARILVPVESFIVGGREGPLETGEEERAEAWGGALVRAYLPAGGPAMDERRRGLS